MNYSPLVSICIPNYNNEKYIRDAIDSAIKQTYLNIEVVVCDNNSTDSSWSIIQSVKSDKIRIFSNSTNIGMVNNFRRVYDLAKGEFITFLCSDDILYPNAIANIMSLYSKYPDLSFVFGNISYSGNRVGSTNYKFSEILTEGKWTSKSLVESKNFTFLTGSVFKNTSIDSSILIQNLIFFDWYLWLVKGLGDVGFCHEELGEHRYHVENQTIQLTPGIVNNYTELKKVIDKLYTDSIISLFYYTISKTSLTLKYAKLIFESKSKINFFKGLGAALSFYVKNTNFPLLGILFLFIWGCSVFVFKKIKFLF